MTLQVINSALVDEGSDMPSSFADFDHTVKKAYFLGLTCKLLLSAVYCNNLSHHYFLCTVSEILSKRKIKYCNNGFLACGYSNPVPAIAAGIPFHVCSTNIWVGAQSLPPVNLHVLWHYCGKTTQYT